MSTTVCSYLYPVSWSNYSAQSLHASFTFRGNSSSSSDWRWTNPENETIQITSVRVCCGTGNGAGATQFYNTSTGWYSYGYGLPLRARVCIVRAGTTTQIGSASDEAVVSGVVQSPFYNNVLQSNFNYAVNASVASHQVTFTFSNPVSVGVGQSINLAFYKGSPMPTTDGNTICGPAMLGVSGVNVNGQWDQTNDNPASTGCGYALISYELSNCIIETSENDPNRGSTSGGGSYSLGDTVTLTAYPNVGHWIRIRTSSGWPYADIRQRATDWNTTQEVYKYTDQLNQFSHWEDSEGNYLSGDNPYIFTATEDAVIIAVFSQTTGWEKN